MSVRLMGEVWGLDVDHARLLVLLALADHADDRGRNIYPSLDLVAWKTGYSKRRVRMIVSELRAKGVLIEVRKPHHHHPTHYHLDLSCLQRKRPLAREEIFSPLDGAGRKFQAVSEEKSSSREEISRTREETAISSNPSSESSYKSSKNPDTLLKKASSEEPGIKSLFVEKLQKKAAEARRRRENRTARA